MDETSEPLLPPEQTTEISPQEGSVMEDLDPKTMRTTKPGLKRLFLTFSVLLSFLLGFPLLWISVEIYRSPLPFADMDTLSKEIESNPLRFPCRFQAIFLSSGPEPELYPDQLHSSILAKMTKLTPQSPRCGSCFSNFSLSVVVDSGNCRKAGPNFPYKCGVVNAVDFESDDDEGVDVALESVLGGGRVYSVVVVVGGRNVQGIRAVVGRYRHAWMVARRGSDLDGIVERAAEIFVKLFVDGGSEEGSINAGFIPVGADGSVVLSFNLLNADPRDWVYDWDFQRIDETLLAPVIEALAPIANISVESQVLYHTPKSSFSSWNKMLGSHIFSTKDLPFFVNSNEWHLDTSTAAGGRSKILQFVVYVPSAKECPLLLQLPNGEISSTNGFISPMWGGVMVWNPYSCSKNSESKHPARIVLSSEDLENVLGIFMGQFRQLVGLKSNNLYLGASGAFNLLASERGFTEWELDFLSRQHTCFNLHSSATTLGSLSRLVQSLPRMIITDEIGKQVKVSLGAAKLAQINASLGVFDASAVSSRQARSLAEDAFFHPSIMSVSYYSFEHCFAVYSPFFLPVSMHIILAVLKEWRRYKQEMAKYLTWKARAKVAS